MEDDARLIADFARHARSLAEPTRLQGAVRLAVRLPGVTEAAYLTATDPPVAIAAAGDTLPETFFEKRVRAEMIADASQQRVPIARLVDGRHLLLCATRALDATQGALVVSGPEPLPPATALHLLSLCGVLSDEMLLTQVEDALHVSEARAQAILETTVDAVITIGEDRRIMSFNRAAERIFGYESAQVMGHDVSMLMPDPYRSEHDAYVERYLRTGQRRIIGIGREVTGLRADGTIFPMELAVSEMVLPGRRLFTGIVRDISERRHLEQEVLRISDMERRRIGQDLHDGLGQMLTGIGLIAGGVARRAKAESPDMAVDIEEVVTLVREADAYARGLARGLVPVELEMGGLTGALERMVESVHRMFDVQCRLHVQGSTQVQDPTVAMHLYRIAQEAVSNAARHSKAKLISVLLVLGDEQVRLRVRDDGVGLPVALAEDALEGPRTGMGLRIMHYRARIIGASLEITTAPEGGTVILCTRRHDGQTPARSLDEQLRDLTL